MSGFLPKALKVAFTPPTAVTTAPSMRTPAVISNSTPGESLETYARACLLQILPLRCASAKPQTKKPDRAKHSRAIQAARLRDVPSFFSAMQEFCLTSKMSHDGG